MKIRRPRYYPIGVEAAATKNQWRQQKKKKKAISAATDYTSNIESAGEKKAASAHTASENRKKSWRKAKWRNSYGGVIEAGINQHHGNGKWRNDIKRKERRKAAAGEHRKRKYRKKAKEGKESGGKRIEEISVAKMTMAYEIS